MTLKTSVAFFYLISLIFVTAGSSRDLTITPVTGVPGAIEKNSHSTPASAPAPVFLVDQLDDIIACDNAFDNGLNTAINSQTCYTNCGNQYNTCATNCQSQPPAQQQQCVNNCETARDNCEESCGDDFTTVFGNSVQTYFTCLTSVEFTMDMCANADAAAQDCLNTRDNCLSVAETSEQQGDCLGSHWECRNASGIDQCE